MNNSVNKMASRSFCALRTMLISPKWKLTSFCWITRLRLRLLKEKVLKGIFTVQNKEATEEFDDFDTRLQLLIKDKSPNMPAFLIGRMFLPQHLLPLSPQQFHYLHLYGIGRQIQWTTRRIISSCHEFKQERCQDKERKTGCGGSLQRVLPTA